MQCCPPVVIWRHYWNYAAANAETQAKHVEIYNIFSPARYTRWLRYVTLKALYVLLCVACLQLAERGICGCASTTVCTRKWSGILWLFTSWGWTLVLLLFSDKAMWRRYIWAVRLKTKIRSNCCNRIVLWICVLSLFLVLTWPFDGGESPTGAWGSPVPQTGADPQSEDGAAGKLWCGKVQPGPAFQQEWVQNFIYANRGLWVWRVKLWKINIYLRVLLEDLHRSHILQ